MPRLTKPQAESGTHLTACHDCDLLFPVPHLQKGEKALCPRCGALVLERKGYSLDYSLALALTSLILFIIANFNTLLKMNVGGRTQAENIISGVNELYVQGYWEIAVLVFIVSIFAPLLKILCLFYVLTPLKMNLRVPYAKQVFRFYEVLHPWAMTEVYMLGILVALVKLADLATINVGIALYSFAALIPFMAATDASLDDHEIWERLEPAD
jgi:paraquat-inducible protein A